MCSFLFVRRTARLTSSSVCSRGLISSLYNRDFSKMTSEAHLLTPEERTQTLQQLQSLGWIEVTARDAIYKEFAFKTFNQDFSEGTLTLIVQTACGRLPSLTALDHSQPETHSRRLHEAYRGSNCG